MARVFFPKVSKSIPASSPHPEGTEYMIAIGNEEWNGNYYDVIKVQMVYNGKISGRKVPSYPIGSDDAERVYKTICELIKTQGE